MTENFYKKVQKFSKNFIKDNYKDFIGKEVIYVNFGKFLEISNEIMNNPEESLYIIETFLNKGNSVRIRLNNISNSQKLKIEQIRTEHINKLIEINGKVIQISEIRPQVVNAKFECPSCGTVISVLQVDKKFREPSRCSCGRRGHFKLISKTMVDTQRLIIEDLEGLQGEVENCKCQIPIFIKEDLCSYDKQKAILPGKNIKVIGILKEQAVKLDNRGGISVRFNWVIDTNNIIGI